MEWGEEAGVFLKGLVVVILFGFGRFVFLGEEMFFLCEVFVIIVK